LPARLLSVFCFGVKGKGKNRSLPDRPAGRGRRVERRRQRGEARRTAPAAPEGERGEKVSPGPTRSQGQEIEDQGRRTMQAPGKREPSGEGIEWARGARRSPCTRRAADQERPRQERSRQSQQEPFSQEEGPSGEPQDTPIPSEQGTPSFAGYSGKSVPPAH